MSIASLVRSAAVAAVFLSIPAAGHAAKPGSVEVSVPDGAMASPSTSLSWRKGKGATFYQVQVYDKKDKKIVSATVTNSEAGCTNTVFCSLTPEEPFKSGPYRWRVRGVNNDGAGPWSSYASFWVGGSVVYQSALVNNGVHEVVPGLQTVTQIEINVPGPGAVHVSTTGLLTCQRSNSTGTVDISTLVTEDPDSTAQGVVPGILVFWSSMGVNDRITHPQATGGVFPVEKAGKKTFYWRTNGFISETDDNCQIYVASLIAEYFPAGGVLEAPQAGAGQSAARAIGPAGSALGR
jgi:hypothetical protein